MNYNYNKNVNDHSEELYQLSRLVSPNFSQIKSELSNKETVGKGCKHIINAITCPFRRAWYGISHLTWITDNKIEKKITNHVTLLNKDLNEMYVSEFKDVKGFVDVSVKKAKKALTRLQKPKDVPESRINLALNEINHIENLWSIEELNTEKEAIIKREKDPLDESNDPLTPKILAHVLGGFMIAGIEELEGSTSSKTINYVLEFIDNYLPQLDKQSHPISSEKILLLKKQLEKAQDLSLKVDTLQTLTHEIAINEKMNKLNIGLVSKENVIEKKETWESQKQTFVSEVLKELNSLEKGQNLLFPGGWTGVPGTPGHAMLYRFEKNIQGKINLSIINTGAGISTHDQTFEVIEGTKKKYNPVRQFDNLSFVDGEIDEKLILSFLEKRLLPLTFEAPAFDSNDIYGIEVERLKSKEVSS